MRAVLDTNALIYYLFSDQSLHKKARELMNRMSSWVIPDLVLHELVWFLKGSGFTKDEAVEVLLSVLTDRRTTLSQITKEDYIEAISLLSEGDMGDIEDVVILAFAARRSLPLLTFDEDLKKLAEEVGVYIIT